MKEKHITSNCPAAKAQLHLKIGSIVLPTIHHYPTARPKRPTNQRTKKNTERTTSPIRKQGFRGSYDSFVVAESSFLRINICSSRNRQFLLAPKTSGCEKTAIYKLYFAPMKPNKPPAEENG